MHAHIYIMFICPRTPIVNIGEKQKMTPKKHKHGEELRRHWREAKRKYRAKKKEAETK